MPIIVICQCHYLKRKQIFIQAWANTNCLCEKNDSRQIERRGKINPAVRYAHSDELLFRVNLWLCFDSLGLYVNFNKNFNDFIFFLKYMN